MLGITESRRLVGDHVLAKEEGDVAFADAIARTGHWTKRGVVYDVPYRCLTTPAVANLLVAGRCISTTRYVHQATKEIPAAMATGEAAGIAAAIAVAGHAGVREVDVDELRSALRGRGRGSRRLIAPSSADWRFGWTQFAFRRRSTRSTVRGWKATVREHCAVAAPRIDSFAVEKIGVGVGFMGYLYRVTIDYGGAAHDGPRQVIVKLPVEHDVTRQVARSYPTASPVISARGRLRNRILSSALIQGKRIW